MESFDAYDKSMRKLCDESDPNIRVIIPAAGTYIGIEEVIEYISLVLGAVNNEYAYYYYGFSILSSKLSVFIFS